MINPKILADSVAELTNIRATTFLLAIPTCKLAELRTHRMICQIDDVMGLGGSEGDISVNANSSRAIPVDKVAQACQESPFVPHWTENQPGMSGKTIEDGRTAHLTTIWENYLKAAVATYEVFKDSKVHKQDANLLFHPFAWSVVVATADQYAWEHFFKLRCNEDVYPAVRDLALQMRELYQNSTPEYLKPGQWHIPFRQSCYPEQEQIAVSASCCARISYANERDERLEKHRERAKRCFESGHVSVFEHQLKSPTEDDLYQMELRYVWTNAASPKLKIGRYLSNIRGWVQARKLIEAGELAL